MRLANYEILYRAFLLHDWFAIVVTSFTCGNDHGGHIDDGLTRYVKFSANWHESRTSKLRVSHLSLEIIA